MHHFDALLRSHPKQVSTLDLVRRCVEMCHDCASSCNGCADACLSEERLDMLRECIRLDLDCADVCAATGAVVSRLTRPHKAPMEALLTACIETCRACAAECDKHAAMHAHCKTCAEACRACEVACAALLHAMP